jgi:hypothetical protein
MIWRVTRQAIKDRVRDLNAEIPARSEVDDERAPSPPALRHVIFVEHAIALDGAVERILDDPRLIGHERPHWIHMDGRIDVCAISVCRGSQHHPHDRSPCIKISDGRRRIIAGSVERHDVVCFAVSGARDALHEFIKVRRMSCPATPRLREGDAW